ncbi:MAG: leucine-rich repeat protein, partial [Clostridia bacterium]|nr:leucine-rich repeat protein [Clostridia bacterium]
MKSFKRALAVLLCVIMTFGIVAVGGNGVVDALIRASANDYDGLSFGYNGEGFTVVGCSYGLSGDIVIPATYYDYPVIGIDDYAFRECQSITSIVIPESVKSIGEGAFFYCSSLTSVSIPDSVESIGNAAFAGCQNLSDVTIPGSVKIISDQLFEYCYALSSITLSYGVESIGSNAFNTSGLTNISIPESVISIENSFNYCTGLQSIYIPKSVTNIKYPFYYCESLESITVSSDNPVYHSDNNCIIETASKTLIAGCKSSIIPNDGSVTSIGRSAFSGATGLKEIVIPEGVTSIGDYAFHYCSGLESVSIPEGVLKINESAFSECSILENVNIPNSVTSIGKSAFLSCYKISNIYISANVTSIESGAFFACSGVESLEVSPDNPVYHSFNNCLIETENRKLIFGCKNSVIPDDGSVTTIGSSAFSWCGGLTAIIIPESITDIGSHAFSYCSNLSNIVIPHSINTINTGVFKDCYKLESLTLSDSIINIGNEAFGNCYKLDNLNIPYSVESIGEGAFKGCSKLETIDIPDSVKHIGKNAFYNTAYYKNESNWDNDNGVLYLGNYLIKGINKNVHSVFTIKEGTVGIADSAMSGCSNLYIVNFPDTVKSIGEYAFGGCGLTELSVSKHNSVYHSSYKCLIETASGKLILGSNRSVIPNNGSVTSIGNSAFSGCKTITSIVIPDGVTSIGDSAFGGCDQLTSITIPASVMNIGKRVYQGLYTRLTDVYYQGSEIDRGFITIGENNDDFLNATWHYNYSITPIEYPTLSYYANGGSGAPSSQTGVGTITLSMVRPTRYGYIFLGWALDSDATEAQYLPGSTFILHDNTNLIAVWKWDET